MKNETGLLLATGFALLMSRGKKSPKAPIPVVLVPEQQQAKAQGGFDDEDFNRGVYTGVAVMGIACYSWVKYIKPATLRALGSGSRYGGM